MNTYGEDKMYEKYSNEVERMQKCINELLQENKQLKKKQKEFIRWLEDTIQKEQKNLDDLCDIYKVPKENNSTYKFLCSFVHRIEEILSKYREVIGDGK